MQVEVALLGWRHKNKHIKCYKAREGGEGGERHYIYVHEYIECCQNGIGMYLAMTVPLERALLHGMSYAPEKKSCMKSLTRPAGLIHFFVA